MTAWLISVILCSAFFLAIYKLLLEREKMHAFNRVYLLGSLVITFIIPLISFPSASSPVSGIEVLHTGLQSAGSLVENSAIEKTASQSIPGWLIVYLVISGLLAFRFIRNLRSIISKARSSTTIRYKNGTIVLVDEDLTPHSFLRYMFINKKQYEAGKIEQEILVHENAHIEQKHSLDILFLEFLQIFFWINPFLFLYRKAIQLNHEFLADDAVTRNTGDVRRYQYLLIHKAGEHQALALTSQFNYLITKKRLIMVTKTRSFRNVICRQIAVIPVLAIAIFLFSTRSFAQEPPSVVAISKKPVPSTKEGVSPELLNEFQAIIDKYKNEEEHYYLAKISDADRKRLETIYLSMSKEQQSRQMVMLMPVPPPRPKVVPTPQQMESWKKANVYGVWINEKRVSNSELEKYKNEDFAQVFVSKLSKNAKNYGKHYYQVDLMTKDEYEKYYDQAMANQGKYLLLMVRRNIPKT